MATLISRLEFRQRYDTYRQGLFIVRDEMRLPKEQKEINAGQDLSELLMKYPVEERRQQVQSVLDAMVSDYMAVTLLRIDILFTPYLELDVIGALSSLCRNRKICIVWPGRIENGKAYYAEPGVPEYCETDLSSYQETYIID